MKLFLSKKFEPIQVIVADELKEEEKKEDPSITQSNSILLNLKESEFKSLPRILKIIEASKGKVKYVESRKSVSQKNRNSGQSSDEDFFDLFMDVDIAKDGLLHVMRSLRHGHLADATILREQLIAKKGYFNYLTNV